MRRRHRRRFKAYIRRQSLEEILISRHKLRDALIAKVNTEEKKEHIRRLFEKGDRKIIQLNERGLL